MSFNRLQTMRDNIEAIRMVFSLGVKGRGAQTAEEIAVLRKYAGFGGLKCILNDANELADAAKCVIRKSKRSTCEKRNVIFLKTKRTSEAHPGTPLFQKNFDPASPGSSSLPAQYLNGLRTLSEGHSFSLFALGRCATAFPLFDHATSTIALYAVTLCALTSLPRKARRDPTYVNAYDAS